MHGVFVVSSLSIHLTNTNTNRIKKERRTVARSRAHRGDEALVDLPEVDDKAHAGGEENHPGGVVVEEVQEDHQLFFCLCVVAWGVWCVGCGGWGGGEWGMTSCCGTVVVGAGGRVDDCGIGGDGERRESTNRYPPTVYIHTPVSGPSA